MRRRGWVSRAEYEAVCADRDRLRAERDQFAADRDTQRRLAATALRQVDERIDLGSRREMNALERRIEVLQRQLDDALGVNAAPVREGVRWQERREDQAGDVR